jgi:hypothetical protein
LRTEAVRNGAYRACVTTIAWTRELVDQLGWHWEHHLRPRLSTLTDDEYLWEPVPGAWSLRRRVDATTTKAAGAGDVVADFEFPEPDPPPVTTIAWRMAHLSIGIFGSRAANHFGDGGVDYQTTDWPLTAAGGLELLDHHYAAWMAGIAALDEDGLAKPCGPAEGPWASAPMAALVLHISREAIHHGAEVCLLRDLYRTRPEVASPASA